MSAERAHRSRRNHRARKGRTIGLEADRSIGTTKGGIEAAGARTNRAAVAIEGRGGDLIKSRIVALERRCAADNQSGTGYALTVRHSRSRNCKCREGEKCAESLPHNLFPCYENHQRSAGELPNRLKKITVN